MILLIRVFRAYAGTTGSKCPRPRRLPAPGYAAYDSLPSICPNDRVMKSLIGPGGMTGYVEMRRKRTFYAQVSPFLAAAFSANQLITPPAPPSTATRRKFFATALTRNTHFHNISFGSLKLWPVRRQKASNSSSSQSAFQARRHAFRVISLAIQAIICQRKVSSWTSSGGHS